MIMPTPNSAIEMNTLVIGTNAVGAENASFNKWNNGT